MSNINEIKTETANLNTSFIEAQPTEMLLPNESAKETARLPEIEPETENKTYPAQEATEIAVEVPDSSTLVFLGFQALSNPDDPRITANIKKASGENLPSTAV